MKNKLDIPKYELKGQVYLADDSSDLIKTIAEKHGIVLPSPDLAIFVTKYAPLDAANKNGVRLDASATKEFLNTINGKLADINHVTNYVIGSILEGWINEDTQEVEIAYTFFKSAFPDEYERAMTLYEKGELFVSFELTTNPDTIESMSDGTIKLHDMIFSGVGVLLDKAPAYAKARTYATAMLETINHLPNLMFASTLIKECKEIIEAEKSKINSDKTDKKGGLTQMTEEQKKLISDLKAEFGIAAKDWKDEDFLIAEKVEALRASIKTANEKLFADSKSLTEEKIVTLTVYKDDGSAETTSNRDCKYTYTDATGNESIQTISENDYVTYVYNQAQLAELKANVEKEIKVSFEKTVNDLKAEIELLKSKVAEYESKEVAKLAAEKAQKIADIKAQLKDNQYAKDFKDEDYLDASKVENAKVLKERDDLKAENTQLKSSTPVVATVEEPKIAMVTGHEKLTAQAQPVSASALINKMFK